MKEDRCLNVVESWQGQHSRETRSDSDYCCSCQKVEVSIEQVNHRTQKKTANSRVSNLYGTHSKKGLNFHEVKFLKNCNYATREFL